MGGATRWQMLRHVYLPAARSEILVGVNQAIMLCLAMVVPTAFIGMPGPGAKLLSLMSSLKLGRSFEIGITIVLIAITLDRLSKAWVVKQPEHFERGTSWAARHKHLLIGIAALVGCIGLAQFVQVANHITRQQDLSIGKEIDVMIRAALANHLVAGVTRHQKLMNVQLPLALPTEVVLDIRPLCSPVKVDQGFMSGCHS
ncbi:MAG: hypothetical protein RQ750_12630, partial [Roseovarius sp.]|nr:hypothetical protein [Roseovarius sp.]